MNWQEGQRVECEGLNWGPCYVTMSNQHMVVIYCPRYEMVTTADPKQLEQAGWKSSSPSSEKVVWMENWRQAHHANLSPVPR
jgi:hypothetical protein